MKPSSFDLTGKVAIISGGATGIGRAIADGLAEAGANLVICGRQLQKCEEACKEIQERTGTRTLAHRCDITSKDEIETLVNTVLDECKRIDILVNNAGVTSNYHVLDLSEEEWDRVMNINLKGYFLCSQAVGRMMAASRGGVIINISSQLGDVARPNRVHYCSAKGGVNIAGAVVFLASEAAAFVTGTTLYVDGGYMAK
jgi:NAD(P)-dependent dehydrogenase (short-subunit alcohol dehydrogenase family)